MGGGQRLSYGCGRSAGGGAMKILNGKGVEMEFTNPKDAAQYCNEHEEIYPIQLLVNYDEYIIFSAYLDEYGEIQ